MSHVSGKFRTKWMEFRGAATRATDRFFSFLCTLSSLTIFADLVSRLRMTGEAQGWPVNLVRETALLACVPLSMEGHFKLSIATFTRR